jgi:thymidylate synthase ThyX
MIPQFMDEKYKRKIYTLEGLSPEVRAVTFAKCSRSPESFAEIAKELTEEKSSEFHEKWVVGYGHSSVAEHAVLSIALENVSILATKVIEDNRLASYTEKSTRYQIFDRDKYYKPKKIMDSPFGKLYEETANFLFDTYTDLVTRVMDYVKAKIPKTDEMTDKIYETTCKAKACDIIRYILPTATLTNLGMTVNARNLEHAITKLLSHPLQEMQEIGKEIKETTQKVTPTLIKYADANPYLTETNDAMEKLTRQYFTEPTTDNDEKNNLQLRSQENEAKLVAYDKDALDRIITPLLYKPSTLSYEEIRKKVSALNQEEKEKILDEALKRLGQFDRPLRELEHTYYTFDILIDYGAFRDIQRHRICTQTNQEFTPEYGYAVHEDIIAAGFEKEYRECMKRAAETYSKIVEQFPKEAQYILPLAYRKRVLITWNLRELFHFIPLRSSKRGHISYRRIAGQIWDEVNKVHPYFARYIKVDKS